MMASKMLRRACSAAACRRSFKSCTATRRQPIQLSTNHHLQQRMHQLTVISHHRVSLSTTAASNIDDDFSEEIIMDDGLDQLTDLSPATQKGYGP